MKEKFGPLKKRDKKLHQSGLNFSEQPGKTFVTTKGKKKFWKLKVEPVERETKKIQIGLATTCDNNEQ
jgi:hypothetical protein